MKKVLNLIIILIICLVIYGCKNTKVTFNYNCPGVSNYECNVLDKKINCTFTMPKCKNKEFNGWYDAPSNGNRVNLDKDFEEDTTLYAHWIDNIVDPTPIDPTPTPEPEPVIEEEYKVIFNANGGAGGQTTSFEMKYEETLPRISEERPIRNGYIFKGWYDNSDYAKGIKYYDENGNPVRLFDKKNDLILYAGWEKDTTYEEPEPTPVEETEYEITFNINGGNGNTPDEINVTYNSKLPNISSSVPTRTGYEFTGWYDNSDYAKGTKYYGTDGKPVRTYNRKSDITLYAGWKIMTYKITYNLNEGSGGQTGSLSVQYNSALPQINKNIPTRSGFTFKGWYDNADYTKGKQYYNENNVAVRNYDKTSNLTLYAGWSKVIVVQTYQVTFNINGGSGSTPGRVNAVLGSAMPSITTTLPTRTNYIFMGWYDNADYTKGTQYYTNKNASARLYDKLNGITLYAGWKENIYTISFNANNGSGGQSASIKVKPNETLPSISKTKPTRSEYTFMGWYDNKDYTKGTQYYKADCTPTKTYQVNKDLSLYAGWKKITYLDPIKPPSTDNVIKSEETDTLKVYITEAKGYYLTRVWAKDPYTQLNKQNANPYGSTLTKPSALLQTAMNEKSLSNKLILGFNASGFYLKRSDGSGYDTHCVNHNPAVNKTSVGTLVITDGKVIRNAYEKGDLITWFIAGVTKDNKMVVFQDTKISETNTTDKKAWADSVISSGIRNTYTFAAPIIENGQKTNWNNNNSRMPGSNSSNKGLQMFCQINANNFAFFTSSSSTRNIGIDVFLNMGCKTAVNLDGGGSVALLFKPSNSTTITTIVGNGRNLPEVGYFSE